MAVIFCGWMAGPFAGGLLELLQVDGSTFCEQMAVFFTGMYIQGWTFHGVGLYYFAGSLDISGKWLEPSQVMEIS